MARPEGLEPPTTWFEARCSIQLSYGRAACDIDESHRTGNRLVRQVANHTGMKPFSSSTIEAVAKRYPDDTASPPYMEPT